MGWEIYTKESRTRSTAPMLTIGQKLARCTLNRSAAALFEREAVEAVLLMWDSNRNAMGIKPINKKDPRSFSVSYSRKKDKTLTGAAFAGVMFLRFIGYDYSTTGSYPIKWNENDSVFELQLPEERFGQRPLLAVEGGRKHGKTASGA